MSAPRRRRRPAGSTWGDDGADDRLGRVDGLDAAKVLRGVAAARDGRTFCLGLPLDRPGGNLLNRRRLLPLPLPLPLPGAVGSPTTPIATV